MLIIHIVRSTLPTIALTDISFTDHADLESGITGYSVGIGTAPDKLNIMKESWPKTTHTVVLSVPDSMLTLGNVYYTTVAATNGVGKITAVSSDGFLFTDDDSSHECIAVL